MLDHAAVLEHQDLVGIDHGRQAVRDDQRGASGGHRVHYRFGKRSRG
jgi:hypothetical protein